MDNFRSSQNTRKVVSENEDQQKNAGEKACCGIISLLLA